MRLNDHACVMEMDTGSAATIISSKMWRSMGSPPLTVSNRLFSAYDGHRMKPVGDIVSCLIEANNVTITSTVTVVESSKQYGLLGRDVLFNFIHAPLAANSIDDAELPAMKVEPVTIEIMDEAQLRFCKARPVPLPMVDEVDKELQRLEQRGIIAPVSNSRWASPVVWVKKRDGSLRMCADFKVHINRSIASDAYPLPTIETIFAGMTDAKAFAKLDLKEAYWQIPLDAKSRELCTINTSKGLYQMLRLPKGMKNSSAIFQRVMESTLKDIPGVVIFQDDILLHAPSSDTLAKRLSSVMNRLDEKGVTVNQSKSILNATEVKFLGHLISSTGIRPDPAIMKKIFSFKPPQSKSELESFLGLVNFFGRMIPDFSKIVNPLHALRKKDVPFEWTYEHQMCFNRLLQVLSEPPVLSSYDLHQPVSLTTDASEKAIGAVLTQNDRPVIFVSRSLTKTEQRYSNIEREALAVVWAVLRLKQFLLGRHFFLITDHRPLEKIYGGAMLPKVTSNRLMRWSILLQRYDFTIRYKPGTEIPHADALTRLQLSSDESVAEDLVINNVAPDVSADWLVSLQEATKSDELAQAVISRLRSDDWRNLRANERHFYRLRHQLTTEDDLLLLNGKCYVPFALRKDVFDSSHQLHTGVHSTINRIKLTSWWPSLHKDVRRWIQNCSSCSKLRPNFVKQLNPWPASSIFERVHADWCHVPGVGDVLVIVDSSSGWIECSLPQSRTSSNVIDSLSAVFSRFGVPRLLVTDNAAEFTSQELNHFCRVNGISKMESPPYHPESNGVAERGVQTVKNGLKAWRLDTTHMPFKEFLKRLLLHHRACFQRPDGRTPAEIVFGRKIRVPLSRDFSFSQPVRYKSRIGTREASFLLERGSNTSWVLDDVTNQLRLAHRDQLAQRPSPSLESTPISSPVKLGASTPAAPSVDPDAPVPTVLSPPVLDQSHDSVPSPVRPTRPTRIRRKKVISDYNDL
jgi:transposase InsO family protein